jgi:hypothetical protein
MVEYFLGAEPMAIWAIPHVSLAILIAIHLGFNVTRRLEVAMDARAAAAYHHPTVLSIHDCPRARVAELKDLQVAPCLEHV